MAESSRTTASGRPGGPSEAGRSVVVDGRALFASGIGRFLREVLGGLLADERFSRIVILGSAAELRHYPPLRQAADRVAIHQYDHPFYSASAQLAWLRLRARGLVEGDVAFFPHYDAPTLAMPRRSVLTVQDLIHFKVPEAFSRAKRLAAGVLLSRVVRQAGVVLVTSEATRRDLRERIPASDGKTRVIPLGVPSSFHHEAAGGEAEAIRTRIGGDYLLCVGNRKPHKNLGAAVEVLARLATAHPELRLVVVGRTLDGWKHVTERAAELNVAVRLVDLPEVSDAELRSLYAGCGALLFPSLYEGFGLPVLEAMACGAPVIASNRASIPEVAGDAALLADPLDHDAMAAIAHRLLCEPELRAEMIARGRRRAGLFPWEESVRRTTDLLFEVASGGAAASTAGARRDSASGAPARTASRG